jgi:hypothetical protein
MTGGRLSEPELALLADLGKLLKKHGTEPFRNLAESLADPEFAGRLSVVLAELSKAAPQRQAAQRSTSSRTIKERIDTLLRSADAAHAELLTPVAESLATGETLPRLRDVTDIALAAGVPASRAKSRGDAIVALMRALIAMPTEELEKVLPTLQAPSRGQRSLEGWNRIIERSRAETHNPNM